MITLTIDGQQLQVADGSTVLEAARQAGIHIPTLCDHPELTPFGGCRLCLVEIEGARTLQASCTLPASNNMVIHTNTPRLQESRKFVLTLLFSERNHFCPFCQVSGGDCELQNAAYEQGMSHWPLSPNFDHFPVDVSHKYFVLDNNRCILCRRCIRACAEMSGNFTLGAEERGAHTMIIADIGIPLGASSCISCGSCLQVCPTGALIDRWAAYRGHEEQVDLVKTTCVGCSVGCGITAWVRDNQIVKIDGDWDASVNNGVLCEVGRFLPMVEQRERITTPLVRKDGSLQPATWEQAIEAVSSQLKPLVGKNGSGVAAMASTRLTAEALHAFRQLFAAGMGSSLVTTTEEGYTTALAAQTADALGKPFEAELDSIKQADCVVILGENLMDDHEVASFFFKRNAVAGVKIVVVDAGNNGLDAIANVSLKSAATPGFIQALQSGAAAGLKDVDADEVQYAHGLIAAARHPLFIYGKDMDSAGMQALLSLAESVHGAVLSVKGAANSLAASRYHLESRFEPAGQQAVFMALADEDPCHCLTGRVKDIPFKVVAASYKSELTETADVVLPVEMWAEQAGHYLNVDGRLLEGSRCLTPADQVRSNLAVVQTLAERLGIEISGDWQSDLFQRTPITVLE